MRHIIFLGGVQYRLDSESPKTHVIIGQRDAEHFRPVPKDEKNLTDDEKVAHVRFVHESTGGRYRLKPLEWAGSKEEAGRLTAQFSAPEWINVTVRSITDLGQIIEHA